MTGAYSGASVGSGKPQKLSSRQTTTMEIDQAGIPVVTRRKTPSKKHYLIRIDELRDQLRI